MASTIASAIVLCLFLSAAPSFAALPASSDPIYIRTDNGWKGLCPLDDDYAEYSLQGSEIQLQDAHHVLLKPSVGMMVTFADKSQFASSGDLLSDHAQWELAYWSKHASRVESTLRDDLGGMRSDLRVTEMRLYNNQGTRLTVYLIALASPQGVLALAVSSPNGNLDPLVKDIAGSFKLVHRKLDPDEVKRRAAEARGK
jgi:hypothetical protein